MEKINPIESGISSYREVPLIAEHDTWITIDPLLGCPASCTYCYLHPLGLTSKPPKLRITADKLILALRKRFGENGPRWGGSAALPMPICIGNYTDQLMTPEGIHFVKEYLPLHSTHFSEHPLCIITKARLKESDILYFDSFGHKVLIFLSQSYIQSKKEFGHLERGPTSLPRDTVRNATIIASKKNLVPLHFWRPLSERTVPDVPTAMGHLKQLKEAGVCATVAIGMKCGPDLGDRATQLAPLFGDTALPPSGQYLPTAVETRALEAGHLLGHPVYRHTSCAVALALGQQEALGTWRLPIRDRKCSPCMCPHTQRNICDRARQHDSPPSQMTLFSLADDIGQPRSTVKWNEKSGAIEVAAKILQSTHTKWTHLTGLPVKAKNIEPTMAWMGDLVRTNKKSKNVLNHQEHRKLK